jgi:hypothetical protein
MYRAEPITERPLNLQQSQMLPQLSKSHISLTYRNTFPSDCVTVAKFNSSDYKYHGLDEIIKLPAVQYIGIGPRLQSTEVILLAKGNTATACLFTEPDPAFRERFDGTAECAQEAGPLRVSLWQNSRCRNHAKF